MLWDRKSKWGSRGHSGKDQVIITETANNNCWPCARHGATWSECAQQCPGGKRRHTQIHNKQPVSRDHAVYRGGAGADLWVEEHDLKSPPEGLSGNLGDQTATGGKEGSRGREEARQQGGRE